MHLPLTLSCLPDASTLCFILSYLYAVRRLHVPKQTETFRVRYLEYDALELSDHF